MKTTAVPHGEPGHSRSGWGIGLPGEPDRLMMINGLAEMLHDKEYENEDLLEKARTIESELLAAGARECLIVGGFVRDRLPGRASRDLDLEVYGIGYEQIGKVLSSNHEVDFIGQQFGIVLVDGIIDVSVPRRGNRSGVKSRGFALVPDPDLTPEEAATRRDFTINAFAQRLDGELFDYFDGRKDLEKGVLRATSDKFAEDPLRVLRGMQLSARLGFKMDPHTLDICRALKSEFEHIAKERIHEEWVKWTSGRNPGLGLQTLQQTGLIDLFPEIAAMQDVPQDPEWHPEGDVFTHVRHVCDCAAEIAERDSLPDKERILLMMSALTHDMGKPVTTHQNDEGRWCAPGHDEAGVPLAEKFLKAIKAPRWLIEKVCPLVQEHMIHVTSGGGIPSDRAVRRLANRLSPSSIQELSLLAESDQGGRPPKPGGQPLTQWLSIARQQAVADAKPVPILMGRHILTISELGIQPGPAMGKLLRQAFEAQLDGEFEDVEGAVCWLKANHSSGQT